MQSDEPDLFSIISNLELFIDEDGSSFSNLILLSPDDGLENKDIDANSVKRNLIDEFSSTSKKKTHIVIKKE